MELHIHQRGLAIGKKLQARIAEHLSRAFRRLSNRIGAITVYLTDTNGPRGGMDKECRIAVELRSGGTVRVAQIDSDLLAAVNVATDRASHTVSRRLGRRRNRALRMKPWPADDTLNEPASPSQKE